MKLVFAGTPEFSVPALQELVSAGHDVAAVYTQPDRAAGRGRRSRPSAVKRKAIELGLDLQQPRNLHEEVERLRGYQADAMIVIAYGLLLPPAVLDVPRFGCLNIHASLLPRWRGAAPIHRAIEAGDSETGITIMQMDAGLDTGDILARYPIPIIQDDDFQSLHDKLALLGARAIVEVLADLPAHRANAVAQDDSQSCYAKKISRTEGVVDWQQECTDIARRIRAFRPWPGMQTWYRDTVLRIHEARAEPRREVSAVPGQVLAADHNGIVVACNGGALRITRLQRAGRKPMTCTDFLNGMPIEPGSRMTAGDSSAAKP
jgi:methionyl-tRNA formyltransferase